MKPSNISGKLLLITLVGIIGLFSACTFREVVPTQTQEPYPTVVRSSPTMLPTKTPPLPTLTSIPDTATPALPSPTAILPTTQPGLQTVNIFLIALEDNGQSGDKIGCDDSVISVPVAITPTLGVLRAALEELLSLEDIYYGMTGLYNSLHQSVLTLESVSIAQGKATIHLSGTLMLSGVCDNPRVEAQLEETALQFSTVNQVEIYVNNVLLEDVLSLK